MTNRATYIVVFDGYADWEPGHALAELRRWGKRTVRSIGFTSEPVVSMGGLRVVPDAALADVRAEEVELLILPGGDMWEGSAYPHDALASLVRALISNGTPVAAICGATLFLARIGALDDRRHTSNMREYLTKHGGAYRGMALYEDSPAVRDDHVITASGLAPVDFAREIFAELSVFSPQDQALWFEMFKHGRIPDAVLTAKPRQEEFA
jgi:putative intracellular protease/amidase